MTQTLQECVTAWIENFLHWLLKTYILKKTSTVTTYWCQLSQLYIKWTHCWVNSNILKQLFMIWSLTVSFMTWRILNNAVHQRLINWRVWLKQYWDEEVTSQGWWLCEAYSVSLSLQHQHLFQQMTKNTADGNSVADSIHWFKTPCSFLSDLLQP